MWRRAISLRNRSARLICGVSAREVPAPPSARDVQLWLGTGAAARRGCGRDKRGPPMWRRAISLRNRSDAIYSTPLHGHSSTSRFDTDRWCTPTDGAFATRIIKNTRVLRILCPFRFATFDYRGDKVLVDHDSGLGWILLRTEISQRMKSHAVRPCARRRRRGCPFPGPPCRPGRRRTCVYGRNELHPSRHGHLTGLGAFGRPAPRAARVLRAPGQS